MKTSLFVNTMLVIFSIWIIILLIHCQWLESDVKAIQQSNVQMSNNYVNVTNRLDILETNFAALTISHFYLLKSYQYLLDDYYGDSQALPPTPNNKWKL
jgi:hypothetical protein